MIAPTWDIAYTTDDASDTTPTWTTVANSDVRSVSVSRGRESELGRVEAGTATLVLNNRGNLFNPVVTTGLRPMNRWRLRATYNAVTYDVFFGYAESYEQQWPATSGRDAITVVRLVDEFKVLALDRLPDTDPAGSDYERVVMFDNPSGYWRFGPTGGLFQVLEATVGPAPFIHAGGTIAGEATPIVGDYYPGDGITITASGARETTGAFKIGDVSTVLASATYGIGREDPGNFESLTACTVEFWFKSSEATPASNRNIFVGPAAGGGSSPYYLRHTTAGKVQANAVNSGGTTYTATGATTLSANTWYHVAMVVTGSNTLIYLNGVLDGTASFTGSFATMDAGAFSTVGDSTVPGGTRYFDEVAVYRTNISATRLLAHYTAGALRGYPGGVNTGDRVDAILDDSTSSAVARNIAHDTRFVHTAYMNGRSPLDMIRDMEAAENVDTIFYIAADGTITFLGSGHRSASPWNSVQATFDDDGTDLPYRDVTVDYSETFLFNEWTANSTGNVVVTASDSTSISRYYKRSQALGELQNETNGDTQDIVDDMLVKYKDPLTRITSITIDLKTGALIDAVLGLELAERIRILRTNVGGGTRIDQTSFIQSINLTATPDRPWQVRFGVSPQ